MYVSPKYTLEFHVILQTDGNHMNEILFKQTQT